MSAANGARLFVALQYLLPKTLLSRLIGKIARSQVPWVRRPLIASFVRGYRPDMSDALQPDPQAYPSFNAFFTRALRTDARPAAAAPHAIVSPVDGRISALGEIAAGRLLQAKGQEYSLLALLAGQAPLATALQYGLFMTIYLAPYNYHRIHMALAGRLTKAWYVPGQLFSVNDATAALVPGLFARNERVILELASEHGSYALVLVGALFVGSMSTVWHGDIAPRRAQSAIELPPPSAATASAQMMPLARGAELGWFNMGSTVILLLPKTVAKWDGAMSAGNPLRVGQSIGTVSAD